MDDAELKPSSSQLGSSVEEEAEEGRDGGERARAAEYRNNRIPFLFIPPVRRCRCHHRRVT